MITDNFASLSKMFFKKLLNEVKKPRNQRMSDKPLQRNKSPGGKEPRR